MVDRPPYFSKRNGRGPQTEPLPFEEFRSLVVASLNTLRAEGLFQEAFGADCVDGDRVGVRRNPEAFFLRTVGRRNVWPYWEQYEWDKGTRYEVEGVHSGWDRDTLFDVVELLHDECSKPFGGTVHGFNDCNCIRNVSSYGRAAGRADFAKEMNEVLPLSDPPYEMNEEGRVVERAPDEFRPLMTAAVPVTPESESVERKIAHAKLVFTERNASVESRREAVRSLADCLERMRPTIKRSMLKGADGALFDLANNFAIRHDNTKQQSDYDANIWLRWMFYVNLATVHAVMRVRARQVTSSSGPSTGGVES